MGNLCVESDSTASNSKPAESMPRANGAEIKEGISSFEIEDRGGNDGHDGDGDKEDAAAPKLVNEQTHALTTRQQDNCEEIFNVFQDEDDLVDTKHLGPMLKALHCHHITPSEVEAITANFHTEHQTNLMTSNQFIQIVAPHIIKANEAYSEEKIHRAFNRFDIDGNGYISASELRIALKENFCDGMQDVAEVLSDEDVEDVMHEADLNGDGRISYSEFMEMIPNLSTAIHVSTKVK
jgi:calmodulin